MSQKGHETTAWGSRRAGAELHGGVGSRFPSSAQEELRAADSSTEEGCQRARRTCPRERARRLLRKEPRAVRAQEARCRGDGRDLGDSSGVSPGQARCPQNPWLQVSGGLELRRKKAETQPGERRQERALRPGTGSFVYGFLCFLKGHFRGGLGSISIGYLSAF